MNLPENHMALIFTMAGGNRGHLLGVIPKQPRTQALARSIMNRYTEIAKIPWTWTKGQGMASEADETAIKFVTDGGLIVGEYPDYPGEEPFLDVQAALAAGIVTKLNPEKKGVEIRFAEKPPDHIKDALKANGFRWSGKCKTWYARQTPVIIAFAERLRGD